MNDSPDSTKSAWECFHKHCESGSVKAAWAVENGLAEAVMKMSFGNNIGFKSSAKLNENWHLGMWGFIVAELTEDVELPGVMKIGETTDEPMIILDGESILDKSEKEMLKIREAVNEMIKKALK